MSERQIRNSNNDLSNQEDIHPYSDLDLDFFNACLGILNSDGDPNTRNPRVATLTGEGENIITIQLQYFPNEEIITASITQNNKKTSQEAPQGASVVIKRDLSKYPITTKLVQIHGDPSLLKELINFIKRY